MREYKKDSHEEEKKAMRSTTDMYQSKFFSHRRADTEVFAKECATSCRGGSVLALQGELGSGKTTFVQAFAKTLGVRRRITSPTFVLMRMYRVNGQMSHVKCFVHVDAYRVRKAEELVAIGLLDVLGRRDTVTIIEWADRVRTIIPTHATWIRFDYGSTPSERMIIIRRRGKFRRRRSGHQALSKVHLVPS